MATMAKQSLALAIIAAGPGGPTVPNDHRYYMVTGGKN
jgi:hypothetical protein